MNVQHSHKQLFHVNANLFLLPYHSDLSLHMVKTIIFVFLFISVTLINNYRINEE